MNSFIVFAKEPAPGKVKTRLTPPFSPEEAVALYSAFVRDVCSTVASCAASGDRLVLAAPGGVGPFLHALAGELAFVTTEQIGPDLGARMARAIGNELAAGAKTVILLGSDSPTLPAQAVRESVRILDGKTGAVIGPAEDGGYWLIGASGGVPDLFEGIAWSTGEVLGATLERARAKGVALSLLPVWYDVDELADVVRVDAHLREGSVTAPATRAALDRVREAHGGKFPA